MDKKYIDKKQGEEDIELVKEEKDPKKNYIFQKTNITKTGFIIILVALILIVIGITFSGAIFGSDV